jgi:hypothetical protein
VGRPTAQKTAVIFGEIHSMIVSIGFFKRPRDRGSFSWHLAFELGQRFSVKNCLDYGSVDFNASGSMGKFGNSMR